MTPILEARGITKSFSGIQALSSVSIDVMEESASG